MLYCYGISTKSGTSSYSYLYVLNVIKKRYKKAESIIAQSHEYAYLYAKDIIKGRWEEAEHNIINSAENACWYALDILKSRWLEAEDLIKNDKALWDIYQEEFCIKE